MASDIRADILMNLRSVNRMALEKGPRTEAAESRAVAQDDFNRTIAEMREYAASPDQKRILDQADANIKQYFVSREQAYRAGVPLAQAARDARPYADAALAAASSLSDIDSTEATRTRAAIAWWTRVAYAEVTLVVLLSLFLSGILIIEARRRIYIPLRALRNGMRRFRAGQRYEAISEAGPEEIAELARTFNEMAMAITRQREEQLGFLAAIAHDLRNPLAALKLATSATLTDKSSSPERLMRMLAVAGRQVDRLDRMTGDLLDAVALEAGKIELRQEACDLREVVRAAVDLFNSGSEGHCLLLSLPEEALVCRCDAARIQQVLDNLISNAIKYSPCGAQIDITLSRRADYAMVAVSDRGIGIPPEHQTRIFEPFHRAPASRTTTYGIGLGLSVTKRILQAHGGHIEVESTPGAGSTFRAYVPL